MKQRRSLRIEDIWYYYKLPILVAGAIVVLVIYMLATAPAQAHRAVVLNVVLVGGTIAPQRLTHLEQQATAAAAPDPSHDEIAIMPLGTGGPLTQDSAANIKFLALLAARSVDVVLMDRADFATLAAHHAFLNLRSLAAVARAQPGAAPVYGVALAGHAHWDAVDAAAPDAVVGIVASTPHRATALRFVQWLLA
jgi:hypothetical protein